MKCSFKKCSKALKPAFAALQNISALQQPNTYCSYDSCSMCAIISHTDQNILRTELDVPGLSRLSCVVSFKAVPCCRQVPMAWMMNSKITALAAQCTVMEYLMSSVFSQFCRNFILIRRQGIRFFSHNTRVLWEN